MKILHVLLSGCIGGAEKLALTLAKIQKQNNHDVTIAFLFRGGPIAKQAKDYGIPIEIFNLKNGYDLVKGFNFFNFLRREKFDIIHIHQSAIAIFFSIFFKKNAIIIRHEHGGHALGPQKKKVILAMRILSLLVDCHIAISNATKKGLIQRFKINYKKIRIVYNGIDLTLFKDRKNKQKLRKQFGLIKNKLVIGSIGRLVSEKGFEHFLKTAKLIKSAIHNIHFLIVGDGPLRNDLQKLAEKLGIANCVSFLGERIDVPDLLSIFDVFLLTSNWEPFGIVLVEAMASGLPIVAFNVDGVSEVVDEKCAVLVEPYNIQKMADEVIKLLKNSEKRKKMGEYSLKRAELFDINKKAKEIEELYINLYKTRSR